MKKITLILITLLAFVYANAQDYTVPRGLPYHDTRWVENKGIAGATYLFDSIVMFRNIADTQMKPLYPAMGFLQDFDGDSTLWIWDMVRWKKLGGGGAAANDRWGIEDNLGIQDRSIDMQGFNYTMINSSIFDIEANSASPFRNAGVDADITSQPYAGLFFTSDVVDNEINARDTVVSIKYRNKNTSEGGSVWFKENYVSFSNDNDVTRQTIANNQGTNRYIPLSVNNNFADANGAITIPIGGTGTVTSFSAGNLSPLFTSSVATSTTTPALTFSLTNAAGGTVFGNNTGSSAAPAYTAVPVLGVAGTTKGTIGLAGNTSGVVTIQPAAAAGTWTLTLPTTGGTNNYVLTTNGSGTTTWTDVTTIATGTVTSFSAGNLSPLFTTSVATASTTPALTFALTNAAAGTVFGNATASAAAPSYTTHPIIGVASGSTGILGISGTTSGTVSLSTADAAGTWTMKLPTTGGTNLFFLQTDGSGNTTWAAPFTLTTTGSSGAATFSSGTLNIPQYSGGSISLSAIGSSPNANAATLTGTVLNLEPANASFGGVVTTATQTFAGDKTLTGNTFLTGTVQTNATSENGNFYIPSSASILGTPTTDARYAIGVVASTQYRAQIGGGSTNATLTASAQFANVTLPNTTVTEASSGAHNAIAQLHIGSLTVTNAGATVTRTAELYLETNGGATGATNYGIYNTNNAINALSTILTTDANTVTSSVTTSTGAATFGAGGTNVNLYVKQTASNTSNNTMNLNSSVTQSGTSGTATTVGVNSDISSSGSSVASNYIAFRSSMNWDNANTLGAAIGLQLNYALGTNASSNAGTITNGYGIKLVTPTRLDSAKFGTFYGVYLDTLKASWTTGTEYAFYQLNNFDKGIFNIFQSATSVGATTLPTSTFEDWGSFALAYVAKAVDYTLTSTDHTVEVTATGKTITLPDATACTGRIYTVKLTASGSGTVACSGGQTIDGSATYSLSAQYKYLRVQSTGSAWIVIANN